MSRQTDWLVPNAFWVSYLKNIVTILISATFRGAALISGRQLFQCRCSKARYLLQVSAYLRSGAYWRKHGMLIFSNLLSTIVFIFWDFLMFYKVFFSPQVKQCAIITYKHGMYEPSHELPNDLKLRILGN